MEIEKLQLDNVEKTENILRILSGLILDTDTLDRVRNVFKSEMALGIQHGLEKVCIQTPCYDKIPEGFQYNAYLTIKILLSVQRPNGDHIRDATVERN